MRVTNAIAVVLSATLVAAACEDKRASPPAAPPEPALPGATPAAAPYAERSTPSLATHMHEHFTGGAKMRDAVIAGDLAALKRDAQWMAEHELSKTFPADWKPHVESFQDAAKKALDARDLDAAANATAEMTARCGSCHAALGGPKIDLGTPPAEGSGVAPHMARHQWAAERMWLALTTPSEGAWLAATETMADAPLMPEALSGERSVDKQVEQLAIEVHAIAERARTDRDMAKWQSAYGKFLGTCADCHKAAGISPKAR
jgi:mono/diheme cytochrome c family protein